MLSRRIIVLFLLLPGCSKTGSSGQKEEWIPPVVAPVSAQDTVLLTFDGFLDATHKAYQAQDIQSLEQLLTQNQDRFTSKEQKPEVDLLQAMLLLSQKKLDKAQTLLDELVKKNYSKSLKGRAQFYRGEIENLRGHLSRALNFYSKAYESFPSSEIESSMADTYAQMGDWNHAILLYRKVLRQNPQSIQDLFFLGAVYYKAKSLIDAKKMMEKVLKLDPKNKYAYQYLAHIAKDSGDQRNYYYNLSRGILLMKNYQAVSELLQGQKLVYRDEDLAGILISSLVHQKKGEQAWGVYQRAVKENPKLAKTEDFQMYYGILYVFRKEGGAKAVRYFQNLSQHYPQNPLILVSYADILKQVDPDNINLVSIYLQILYLQPSDTATRYELATWYHEHQNENMAQLQYGILYFYQDQKEEALESLLSLEKKAPHLGNVSLYLYVGLLYQQKGEKDLARQYYQKVLMLDKKNPEARVALDTLNR